MLGTGLELGLQRGINWTFYILTGRGVYGHVRGRLKYKKTMQMNASLQAITKVLEEGCPAQ